MEEGAKAMVQTGLTETGNYTLGASAGGAQQQRTPSKNLSRAYALAPCPTRKWPHHHVQQV